MCIYVGKKRKLIKTKIESYQTLSFLLASLGFLESCFNVRGCKLQSKNSPKGASCRFRVLPQDSEVLQSCVVWSLIEPNTEEKWRKLGLWSNVSMQLLSQRAPHLNQQKQSRSLTSYGSFLDVWAVKITDEKGTRHSKNLVKIKRCHILSHIFKWTTPEVRTTNVFLNDASLSFISRHNKIYSLPVKKTIRTSSIHFLITCPFYVFPHAGTFSTRNWWLGMRVVGDKLWWRDELVQSVLLWVATNIYLVVT